MSNDNEQGQSVALIPEVRVPSATALLLQTEALVQAGMIWQDGRGGATWYAKDLMGVAFAITSEPRYSTEPAHKATRADGTEFVMQAQDVAQVTIRFFNAEDVTFGEPVPAQFSDKFLVNQIKGFTLHELTACLWTVARRPGSKYATPSGQARMLKVYEHGKDVPPDQDNYAGSVLADDPIGPGHLASTILEGRPLPPDKATSKVRAEIARMRGQLPPSADAPSERTALAQSLGER